MAESTVLVVYDEPLILEFLAENRRLRLEAGCRHVLLNQDHTGTTRQRYGSRAAVPEHGPPKGMKHAARTRRLCAQIRNPHRQPATA
jgi:hypothetical protein